MTDELAKRLRDSTEWYSYDAELKMKCADRIEELEADLRKMALDYLAAQGQASENFQMYVDANEARIDAETSLAKAVEALDCWLHMMDNPAYDLGEMVSEFDAIVYTTLAELKEQKL